MSAVEPSIELGIDFLRSCRLSSTLTWKETNAQIAGKFGDTVLVLDATYITVNEASQRFVYNGTLMWHESFITPEIAQLCIDFPRLNMPQ